MSDKVPYKVLDTIVYVSSEHPQYVEFLYYEGRTWVYIRSEQDCTQHDSKHDLFPLKLEEIHPPRFPDAMHKFAYDPSLWKFIYVKRPNYLDLLDTFDLDTSQLHQERYTIVREVLTCEALMTHPHPNIARYYGVEASDTVYFRGTSIGEFTEELVTGICYERYDCSLDDLVARKVRLDVPSVIADVFAGMRHMHSINLVHCDIKPENIFYKNGVFVLGDFDSTHHVNSPIRGKRGTPHWYDIDDIADAQFDHDVEALRRVEEWLEEKQVQIVVDEMMARASAVADSWAPKVGCSARTEKTVRSELIGRTGSTVSISNPSTASTESKMQTESTTPSTHSLYTATEWINAEKQDEKEESWSLFGMYTPQIVLMGLTFLVMLFI